METDECNSRGEGGRRTLLLGVDMQVWDPSGKEEKSDRGDELAQRDSILKPIVLFQPFSCHSFFHFRFPQVPAIYFSSHKRAVLPFQMQTWGTPRAGTQGLAWLDKPMSFAKLLWPVRQREAMPQSTMLAAGARFQPGHAGNMPCLALSDSKITRESWSQKLLHFLFCHSFPPPPFCWCFSLFSFHKHTGEQQKKLQSTSASFSISPSYYDLSYCQD